jgi:hypothetical protein
MRSLRLGSILLALLFRPESLLAERGVLVLYVSDVRGRPVSGVEIATNGDGGSDRTIKGRARIPLAPDQSPSTVVTLHIAFSPKGHNYVLISPWDGVVRVPPFQNSSGNSQSLVVAESGDRDLLTDRSAIVAIVNQTVRKMSPTAPRA